MDVGLERIKGFTNQLRFDNVLPPREATGALFTLLPAPDEVVTSAEWEAPGQRGGVKWTLLGHQSSGLAVVRAESSTGWNAGVREPPRESTLTARWRPVSQVRSISVTDIQVFNDRMQTGDVLGRETWQVEIEGEGIFSLLSPADEPERAATFCRHLQDSL